jgi:hypothetical protein
MTMANIACTQLNLAFQTLDEITQDLVKAQECVITIRTKIKDDKKNEYSHILTFLSLELNNLRWCLRNAVQKDERLNAVFRNLELIG